jgi:hypothetical protein
MRGQQHTVDAVRVGFKGPFMASDREVLPFMASAREVLTLVCASCGRIFVSTLQMRRSAFVEIRMSRKMECCPSCGRASRYSKADYLFRCSDPSQWEPPRILGER